jgi:hypothetical protein
MNKIELYNKIVEIYKKTGQGTPKFIETKIGSEPIEDLINDGLIKIVTEPFNHLPDNVTICLTKGYCVEEDLSKGDHSALTYMRIYLNIDPVIQIGGNVLTLKDAIQDSDWMDGYSKWLHKNKDKLAEISTIEKLDESNLPGLSEELVEYIKTLKWYEDNQIVSVCLDKMNKATNDIIREFSIYNELVSLKKISNAKSDVKKYNIDEDIVEKEKLEKKIKNCKRIYNWLSEKDGNMNIQSLI